MPSPYAFGPIACLATLRRLHGQPDLTPAQKCAGAALLLTARSESGEAWASYAYLEQRYGVSSRVASQVLGPRGILLEGGRVPLFRRLARSRYAILTATLEPLEVAPAEDPNTCARPVKPPPGATAQHLRQASETLAPRHQNTCATPVIRAIRAPECEKQCAPDRLRPRPPLTEPDTPPFHDDTPLARAAVQFRSQQARPEPLFDILARVTRDLERGNYTLGGLAAYCRGLPAIDARVWQLATEVPQFLQRLKIRTFRRRITEIAERGLTQAYLRDATTRQPIGEVHQVAVDLSQFALEVRDRRGCLVAAIHRPQDLKGWAFRPRHPELPFMEVMT